MDFFERDIDMEKQKTEIRRKSRQKRAAITHDVWLDGLEDKICITQMSVFGLGVTGFFNKTYKYCDNFKKKEPCDDKYCMFRKKNHDYINYIDLRNTIRAAQWNLIKEALHLQKQ